MTFHEYLRTSLPHKGEHSTSIQNFKHPVFALLAMNKCHNLLVRREKLRQKAFLWTCTKPLSFCQRRGVEPFLEFHARERLR